MSFGVVKNLESVPWGCPITQVYKESDIHKSLGAKEKNGGNDGTRTRGLLRDRQAL